MGNKSTKMEKSIKKAKNLARSFTMPAKKSISQKYS